MKVQSLITDGALLPKKYSAAGYTAKTTFALTIGKTYEAYGTSVWRSIVSVLVMDDDDFPTWYPMEVFTTVDETVPDGWFFKYFTDSEFSLEAIWGPERLVKEEGFYDALSDRDPSALHKFRTELSR
jgi:hypothetical protein